MADRKLDTRERAKTVRRLPGGGNPLEKLEKSPGGHASVATATQPHGAGTPTLQPVTKDSQGAQLTPSARAGSSSGGTSEGGLAWDARQLLALMAWRLTVAA